MVARLSKPMLLSMTHLQKARAAVFTYFLLCGSAVTVWATHIPEVQKALALSTAQIGIIILILGAGALTSMQFVGAWIDREGSAKVLVFITSGLGVSLVFPGLASSFWTLAVAIFFLGSFIGGVDIAMNAHALEVEKAYSRPIFSAFHAMWSIGGVLGAIVVGVTLSFNLAMSFTMLIWGILTLLIGLFLRFWLLPGTKQTKLEMSTRTKSKGKEFSFVIFVGVVSAAGAMIEGIGIDWSPLYTVEKFQVSSATAAITLTIFSATMAAVRFVADKVVAATSRIFVIRMGAFSAAFGIALALASPIIQVSWVGWALVGIGISAVVPQCMAFGSEIGSPEHQGRNLAKVVGLTYAGVLGGPAVIGFVGEVLGLQISLAIGVALALFIAISSVVMVKGKEILG